jgi:outer membrane protein W
MMRAFMVTILLLFCSHQAFAAQITKVKNSGALISLDGETATVGQYFFTLNAEGKKVGLLSVVKVNGDKAIGKILKGKVEVGQALQARAVRKGGGKSAANGGFKRAWWGGMLGYAHDAMSAQVLNTANQPVATDSLSGSGFSVNGLFDYQVFSQIWFRGLLGVEMFNVTGGSICANNTQTCSANIDYVSMDFIGRYLFSEDTIRPWLGAGVAMMFPASKSATVLQADSIGSTSVLQVTGGLDWMISPNAYIPISIEYGLLPKSSQVSANWVQLRVGVALPF